MEKLTFTAPIYTHQIDFAGHVNNGVYFKWLEEARQELLASVEMPIAQLVAQGVFPVLANLAITYKHPLYLENTMHLLMWVTEVRFASVQILAEIYNELGMLSARATQQALFIDTQTRKPQRLGLADRERFKRYLIPPVA